ncbi:hypothetical protein N9J96_04165 [Paracoccaceae bacterium]|jgi:geranyl-CoA carboxylase beta subunit|nr:hypothetical protein [Paracoccaceae bacterium]
MTIPANKKGKEVDKKVMRKQRLAITDDFKRQSSAFYTSGRLFDKGIIYPCDTRKILGFCLKTCWGSKHRNMQINAFGVDQI